MNEDAIAGLKQFIVVTVSQQTSNLSGKIDDLSAAAAEALGSSNESVETRPGDHEHRLTRLEHI